MEMGGKKPTLAGKGFRRLRGWEKKGKG